jgi:hypothetical protein
MDGPTLDQKKKTNKDESFEIIFRINVWMAETRRGHRCPIILCDLCKERIVNAGNAMVFWNDNDKTVVAHKDCMLGVEDNNTLYPSSYELNDVLGDLVYNVGNHDLVKWAKSEERFAENMIMF